MAPSNVDEQLVKYLTDVHSIERQALIQMQAAPRLTKDERLSQIFTAHKIETEQHERLVAERLRARGGKPNVVKDVAGTVTGAGFGIFAALNPDTPVKLLFHAYSYEHMEEAAYDLLGRVASKAGDTETVSVAAEIERQEGSMGERIADQFDTAVELVLAGKDEEQLQKTLGSYLADAHALEKQSVTLLARSPGLVESAELRELFNEHQTETEGHLQLIEERLSARGDSANWLKDAALKLGALNWGLFFGAQPDTPAKLAAFAYAVENLEIACYSLLERVAKRAGDAGSVELAQRILPEEQAAAKKVRANFGLALDETLTERNLAA